jgi:outer membrane protein assembly factor BamB
MSSSAVPRWRIWLVLAGALAAAALAAVLILRVIRDRNLRGQPSEDPDLLRQMREARLDEPARDHSGTDWPQWRGPARDGASRETGLLAEWPADAASRLRVWQKPGGGGFGTLAVARGRAVALLQKGPEESVVCWDALTGKELWSFRYLCRYVNPYGSGPRSTPSIDGDRVYTVGATGIMHCLKLDPQGPAGEAVWRKDLLQQFGASNLRWGVSFSPLVVGDLVYTNPGGPGGKSLVALDKRTGAVAWQTGDDPAGYSSPVLATLAGRPQVVFFTGSGLVAVTPDRGEVLWRYPWETEHGANIATPITAGDYVFISSGYGRGCTVVKVEASGGALQARKVYENLEMCTHFSTCVRQGDYLYGFHEKQLRCLELRTGKVRWKQRGFDKGSLLIADGKLIILGEEGKLALAEATPEGYRERSSFQLFESRSWTVPVLAGGRLYVRDESQVVCLDLRKR